MLKLKLQYFGHWCEDLTHWKRPWCWGRLKGKEKRMTEDKMVGWHHQFNGPEFEQTLGDSEDREAWHVAVHGWQRVRHDWGLNNNNALGARALIAEAPRNGCSCCYCSIYFLLLLISIFSYICVSILFCFLFCFCLLFLCVLGFFGFFFFFWFVFSGFLLLFVWILYFALVGFILLWSHGFSMFGCFLVSLWSLFLFGFIFIACLDLYLFPFVGSAWLAGSWLPIEGFNLSPVVKCQVLAAGPPGNSWLWRLLIGMTSLRGPHLGIKIWLHLTVCKLQCQNT